MSPLFSCAGCGVQIERSVRLYREQKGRVYCSTCIDRQEARLQPQPDAAGEAARRDTGPS